MVAKFVLHAVFKSLRHGLVGEIRFTAVLGPGVSTFNQGKSSTLEKCRVLLNSVIDASIRLETNLKPRNIYQKC